MLRSVFLSLLSVGFFMSSVPAVFAQHNAPRRNSSVSAEMERLLPDGSLVLGNPSFLVPGVWPSPSDTRRDEAGRCLNCGRLFALNGRDDPATVTGICRNFGYDRALWYRGLGQTGGFGQPESDPRRDNNRVLVNADGEFLGLAHGGGLVAWLLVCKPYPNAEPSPCQGRPNERDPRCIADHFLAQSVVVNESSRTVTIIRPLLRELRLDHSDIGINFGASIDRDLLCHLYGYGDALQGDGAMQTALWTASLQPLYASSRASNLLATTDDRALTYWNSNSGNNTPVISSLRCHMRPPVTQPDATTVVSTTETPTPVLVRGGARGAVHVAVPGGLSIPRGRDGRDGHAVRSVPQVAISGGVGFRVVVGAHREDVACGAAGQPTCPMALEQAETERIAATSVNNARVSAQESCRRQGGRVDLNLAPERVLRNCVLGVQRVECTVEVRLRCFGAR